MSPLVRFEVVKDEIRPQLQIMTDRASDFSGPLEKILGDATFSVQEQIFEGKGSLFGGVGWFPMADSTIAKGRDPNTLLVDSGIGMLSFTRGAPGNIFDVGPLEGVAGSEIVSTRNGYPYMLFQQLPAPRANRPARRFLFWPEERFERYGEEILDHLTAEGPNG